ncbi:MAG: HAMP domain-containing histidine kinase, partial [Sphingobacteriales bacterium]
QRRVDVQAQKMSTMIHDFLSMARLQEGKLAIVKTDFPLLTLMEEITGDVQFLSPGREIELTGCGDITVHADREKIGQVMMNLLTNAIKYSPGKGKVTIGCRQEADLAIIYVTDQGVGISENDQERLFERFFRSSNEKTKTIAGFGIGLYLVAEILRAHDATIQVESRENEGSTFYFELKIVT